LAASAGWFSLSTGSQRPLPVPASSRHAELVFEGKIIEPEFAFARSVIHTSANNRQ
jgi:hypothetical protein